MSMTFVHDLFFFDGSGGIRKAF